MLEVAVGDRMWVINKQSPNKQIWWSSPFSGPKRFEWSSNSNPITGEDGSWMCTKEDGFELVSNLIRELDDAIEEEVRMKEYRTQTWSTLTPRTHPSAATRRQRHPSKIQFVERRKSIIVIVNPYQK